MPIPCPPTPFVSNSSIWKDPGVNNGLSLPSDLIGTVCPSLAEAAGGAGVVVSPMGYKVLLFTHHPVPQFLPGQETLLAACLALTVLLIPSAGFSAS